MDCMPAGSSLDKDSPCCAHVSSIFFCESQLKAAAADVSSHAPGGGIKLSISANAKSWKHMCDVTIPLCVSYGPASKWFKVGLGGDAPVNTSSTIQIGCKVHLLLTRPCAAWTIYCLDDRWWIVESILSPTRGITSVVPWGS